MSCVTTLRDRGLRLTPQRRMILDIFHDKTEHITADDIITRVKSQMPGVNKSTIYRTLGLLEQTGCVFKSECRDGIIYHHAEEGHHYHLICQKCGKTVYCRENLFLPVERYLTVKYGFRVDFKHVMVNGLCETCKGQV